MTRTRLAFSLGFALALVCGAVSAQDHDDDVDKVNGSITADSGQTYGDLSTVNGSIRIESNARTGDASTVNGSIQGGDAISTGDLSTVNGSIKLGTKARVADGIDTVNGSIFVDRGGDIAKGVETVNGAIGLVDTDLGAGIETVNGDITVGIGSHVHGGIHVEKPGPTWFSMHKNKPPRIIIGPNAQVDGPMVFEREVVLYVHTTAKVGSITGAKAIPYSTDVAPTQ